MKFPARNKYSNRVVSHAGYSFASKAESALFDIYYLQQKQGLISELKCQDVVYLTDARIMYKPDFTFIRDGIQWWGECKGFETDVWRIKRRLWKCYGPGKLEVWKGSWKRLSFFETLVPK